MITRLLLILVLTIVHCTNMYAQCTPGATIRVGTTCTCNTCTEVTVMSLESYTASGLDDEWIPSWHAESLKAGSVAYRSYGAYYINNPYNGTYDISNTTCRQVWDASTSSACMSAAAATSGQVLSQGVGGPIARSEYAAETNSFGCGDGFSGCSTCTPAWPCIPDAVCAGKASFGHWRGMCQWGSQRWAQAGQTWTWIINHYYNPGNVFLCGSVAPCSPNTTTDFCYGPPAPTVLATGTNCNPTNGTTCGATPSINTSSASCSRSGANSNVPDVWYAFTATSPLHAIHVKGGANFDAVAEVYSTVCSTATLMAPCVNSNGTGQPETITIGSFTPGNTYYIRIYDHAENNNQLLPGGTNFSVCIYNPLTGSVVATDNTPMLQVTPNPGTDMFFVAYTGTATHVSVANMEGKVLDVPISINPGQLTAHLGTLPSGMYCLTAWIDDVPQRCLLVKM